MDYVNTMYEPAGSGERELSDKIMAMFLLSTGMRRLTTGIHSEKCVFRRFHRCVNVIECTYINLDSAV